MLVGYITLVNVQNIGASLYDCISSSYDLSACMVVFVYICARVFVSMYVCVYMNVICA